MGRENTGTTSNVGNRCTSWLDLISSSLVCSRSWQGPLGPDPGAWVPRCSLPHCRAGTLITARTSDAVRLPFQLLPSSLHADVAAPAKPLCSAAVRMRMEYLCRQQAGETYGTRSWFCLLAMFQSLLGFPCLRKTFVLLEKVQRNSFRLFLNNKCSCSFCCCRQELQVCF